MLDYIRSHEERSSADGFILRFIWPFSKREQEIKEVMKTEIDDLRVRIAHLSDLADDAKTKMRTLEDYVFDTQWALSVGASIADLKVERHVPVRIYLGGIDSSSGESHSLYVVCEKLEARLLDLLDVDFERATELPIEYGSLWRRFWLKTRQKAEQRDVEGKLETALEIRYLDKPQAEATKALAEGIAVLLSPLENVPSACIQIGNVLVVKYVGADGKVHVLARSLSPIQMKQLEQNRSILQEPKEAVKLLLHGTHADELETK